MSIEKVKQYFQQFDMQNRVRELSKSSATVEEAAAALQCERERIAKTLSFHLQEKAILVVVAGDAKIDNGKYKQYFGEKAKMIGCDEVEPLIGHRIGGVCPFCIKEGVDVYLDISLKRFETVFPAGGSANSGIELTIEELEQHSNYMQWVDVCKNW